MHWSSVLITVVWLWPQQLRMPVVFWSFHHPSVDPAELTLELDGTGELRRVKLFTIVLHLWLIHWGNIDGIDGIDVSSWGLTIWNITRVHSFWISSWGNTMKQVQYTSLGARCTWLKSVTRFSLSNIYCPNIATSAKHYLPGTFDAFWFNISVQTEFVCDI